MIIYNGPSLIDGSHIVAIALPKRSRNSKTGNMVQTYIIRADMSPMLASKTGKDHAICGTCPMRGTPTDDPARKIAVKRKCYVNLSQGPTQVWKAFERGNYATVFGHDAIAAIGKGRMVRLGTYGDPAAVPSYIWESLMSLASGHTAYTHQNFSGTGDVQTSYMMVSADNEAEARETWGKGGRTFRVINSVSELVRGSEIICPASKEAGFVTTCNKCGLCGGAQVKAKSIAIVDHGPQRNRKEMTP